jgi:hypothetical protein
MAQERRVARGGAMISCLAYLDFYAFGFGAICLGVGVTFGYLFWGMK